MSGDGTKGGAWCLGAGEQEEGVVEGGRSRAWYVGGGRGGDAATDSSSGPRRESREGEAVPKDGGVEVGDAVRRSVTGV